MAKTDIDAKRSKKVANRSEFREETIDPLSTIYCLLGDLSLVVQQFQPVERNDILLNCFCSIDRNRGPRKILHFFDLNGSECVLIDQLLHVGVEPHFGVVFDQKYSPSFVSSQTLVSCKKVW